MLKKLRVHPVFTAHPTEARRRAVVTAIGRVAVQLHRVNDESASATDRTDSTRRLLEEIAILWRTGQLRSAELHPLDEVRALMAVFDETLFNIVPDVCRAFEQAIVSPDDPDRGSAGSFLRFGTWVGGDRDGNPSVTAQVTEETMASTAGPVLLALDT